MAVGQRSAEAGIADSGPAASAAGPVTSQANGLGRFVL